MAVSNDLVSSSLPTDSGKPVLNRQYLYSQYWTEISLSWKLVRGDIIKKRFEMSGLRISLGFKLVPGLFSSLSREKKARRVDQSEAEIRKTFPALCWIMQAVFTPCTAAWFCAVGFQPE